jgi:hypothetical protein
MRYTVLYSKGIYMSNTKSVKASCSRILIPSISICGILKGVTIVTIDADGIVLRLRIVLATQFYN